MSANVSNTSEKMAATKVSTELLFTLLPFIIAAIVLNYRGAATHLFYLPEWAIAATVLQGQALAKFIAALFTVSKTEGFNLNTERSILLFTLQLVFLFVPTVLVLVFILLNETPSVFLAILQVVSFVVGGVVFFFTAFLLESSSYDATRKFVEKTGTQPS